MPVNVPVSVLISTSLQIFASKFFSTSSASPRYPLNESFVAITSTPVLGILQQRYFRFFLLMIPSPSPSKFRVSCPDVAPSLRQAAQRTIGRSQRVPPASTARGAI